MGVEEAIAEISTFLGQRITRSKSDLDLHGRSESHFPLSPPDAVAYPESTAEVVALVQACAARGVPLVGWHGQRLDACEGTKHQGQKNRSLAFHDLYSCCEVTPIVPGASEQNNDLWRSAAPEACSA